MKKNKWIFVFLMVVTLFASKKVFAASASISASRTSAYVGESVTITVNYYAASWNLSVSGSVNDTIVGYDMNGNVSGSQSYTLAPSSPGTYKVFLSGDVSDYDDTTIYPSGSVSVTFTQRPATPQQPSQPQQPSTPATPDNRSSNCSLKSITVDGYELEKKEGQGYFLTVKNSVDKITIKAEAEDSKTTIEGTGLKNLIVGENKFDVVAKAENGAQCSYTIFVTRKDNNYTLDRLQEAIEEAEDNEVELILGKESVLKKEDLETMKKSGKKFYFTKYDDDKNVLYTWIIDGKNVQAKGEIDLSLSDVDKPRNVQEVMNYADGILFQLQGSLPKGTELKLYVGDKYTTGDLLNLFSYQNKDKKLISNGLKVENGFVMLSPTENGTYFLTLASFEEASQFNIFIPICIAESAVILILLFLFLKKGKKKKEPVAPAQPAPVVPPTVPTPVVTPLATDTTTFAVNPNVPDFQVYPEKEDNNVI